jgi:hypothetical protein
MAGIGGLLRKVCEKCLGFFRTPPTPATAPSTPPPPTPTPRNFRITSVDDYLAAYVPGSFKTIVHQYPYYGINNVNQVSLPIFHVLAELTTNRVRTLTGKEIELDIEPDYKVYSLLF